MYQNYYLSDNLYVEKVAFHYFDLAILIYNCGVSVYVKLLYLLTSLRKQRQIYTWEKKVCTYLFQGNVVFIVVIIYAE